MAFWDAARSPCLLAVDDDLDLLMVPQGSGELSSGSLEAADSLFDWSMEHSAEATSSLGSSPHSEASSSLDQLAVDFQLPLGVLEPQQQGPVAAPLPLGLNGLKLKLDTGSVLSAWAAQGGAAAAHPFQLRGPALASATAALPSADDLAASLAAAAQAGASDAAAAAQAGLGAGAQAAAVATRPAKTAEFKRPAKRSSDRKTAYPMRKSGSDKRPRIKGRFVTRTEFEQMLTGDRAVPAAAPAPATPSAPAPLLCTPPAPLLCA